MLTYAAQETVLETILRRVELPPPSTLSSWPASALLSALASTSAQMPASASVVRAGISRTSINVSQVTLFAACRQWRVPSWSEEIELLKAEERGGLAVVLLALHAEWTERTCSGMASRCVDALLSLREGSWCSMLHVKGVLTVPMCV